MKKNLYFLLLAMLALFTNCNNSDDNDNSPANPKDSIEILSFQFLAKDNPELTKDYDGIIDSKKNTIFIELPRIDDKNLIPKIETLGEVTITPPAETKTDFSISQEYILQTKTSTKIYSIIVIFEEVPIGNTFKFQFLKKLNPSLDKDYEAKVDFKNQVISLEFPENSGVDLKNLKPTITSDFEFGVAPFNEKAIDFTVQEQKYMFSFNGISGVKSFLVDVYKPKTIGAQRHALLDLYFANQPKLNHWKISRHIKNWNINGEVLYSNSNNRIRGVNIQNKSDLKFPESIKLLSDNFPTFSIRLSGNEFTEIPENLFLIKNVSKLFLDHNNITIVPDGIKNFKNLENLDLSNNQIENLPEVITELEKLNIFYIRDNNIETLSKSICDFVNTSVGLFVSDDGVCP